MLVKPAHSLPAMLMLLVLLGSQAAYAAGAFERAASDHCARSMPAQAPARHCPLPLWLSCCDDQAAVPAGAAPLGSGSQLLLPLATALVQAPVWAALPGERPVPIPPDTPLRLSSVLLI